MRLILLLLSALVATPLAAQPAIEAALRQHIAVLASDDFGGRKPGTDGETKTVGYVAAQLAGAGLRPGAKDGGWYQRVDLVHREPVVTRIVVARGGKLVPIAGEVTLIGREAAVRLADAPVVYAGYARPEDLAGLDLTGALVLFRPDLPQGMTAAPGGERRAAIVAKGAGAVLAVYDGAPWAEVGATAARGIDTLASDPGAPLRGVASVAAAKAILAAAGAPTGAYEAARPLALSDATARVEATTAVRAYPSYNVVGLLPGRNPRGEAIAFTAHWDHLGTCRPEGAPDRICNGAVDNASGTAMLIEIARGLAKAPPPRDAYFVATTAEELGLLGAEAFASDPPRPLRQIVAALNLDTTAITAAGQPVAIIGRGLTPSLDAAVDAVARKLGRKVDSDTEANVLVSRQDGWALGKRGLASVMIGGSFSDMTVLEGYLGGNYHTPTDDLAHLPPLGGAAEDVALHIAAGEALGDPPRYPTPAAK